MRLFLPRIPAPHLPPRLPPSPPREPTTRQGRRISRALLPLVWTAASLFLLSLLGLSTPGVSARTHDSAAALSSSAGNAGESKEYQVKAAFLYNIISYTTWPKGTAPPKGQPVKIAIIGKNPYGDYLDGLLKTRAKTGLKAIARYYPSLPKDLDAQVVFMVNGKPAERKLLLEKVKGKPILIVGESTGYALEGAHVNFFINKGRIQFEVNLEALRLSKLTMSSQLLKLARIVKKESR